MGNINLTDSRGRDAVVMTLSARGVPAVRWVDEQGRQARPVRLLTSTLERDFEPLVRDAGSVDQLTDALIAADPEVDLEQCGRYIRDTSRVYIDPDGRIVHSAMEWEVLRSPDGTVRTRRPRRPLEANLSGEHPIRWTGRLMKRSEVYNRFVFVSKMQITHFNGLTYDFLYGMAHELEARDSLLLLGAGPRGRDPLLLRRNGTPYRGFLEGRTQGARYCLLLHLSNLELRAPDGAGTG